MNLYQILKISLFCLIFLFVLKFQISAQTREPVSFKTYLENRDTISNITDSIASERIDNDSLYLRNLFVKDSILKRQFFIRDSIAARKNLIDSLNTLKNQLEPIFKACYYAMTDDYIFEFKPIRLKGDSVLGPFTVMKILNEFDKPYQPWSEEISFDQNVFEIKRDAALESVESIKSSKFTASFKRDKRNPHIDVIYEPFIITTKHGKSSYRQYIDSVFYNPKGQIVKVKKYAGFYEVLKNYQRGNHQYTALQEVKQYTYENNSFIKTYQVVKFCESDMYQPTQKVCRITDYTVLRDGNKVTISQQDNPANAFTDAQYTYIFNSQNVPSEVHFINSNKTKNWRYVIDTDLRGNVVSYTFYDNSVIAKMLTFEYKKNVNTGKTIVHSLESMYDEGVCVFQKDNSTGKSRSLDMYTGEWSRWK